MKAERRHELKHNELADWLGERMEAAKPHATGILLGLVLLVLVVLGSIWYFGSENTAAATAWGDYFAAFNEREPQKVLQQLAQEKSGTKAAWWALEAVGDMNSGQGAALLYSDRNEAKKYLEQAEAAYQRVLSCDDSMLKTRAQLGLAKVYESLCKPEEAFKYYDLIAKSQPNSAIGKAAATDALRMKNARDVAFLEWFAQQTPKRPAPLPGVGGGIPSLPNDLPDRPDLSLPTGLNLGDLGSGAPTEPGATFPAPGAPAEGAAAPAATTPEAPAADAPKASEAKGTESPAAPNSDAVKAPPQENATNKQPE